MPDFPVILQYQQGNDVAAAPDGYQTVTSPLTKILRSGSRLAHFTDGVYDLSGESRIIKLLKVLLGDAGVGHIQHQLQVVRLNQALAGTHFFDLDRFYGALFGVGRRPNELLPYNPITSLVPTSEWDELRSADGSYHNRVARLSAAIHLGATIDGLRSAAEALTGITFDVIESWQYGAFRQRTWNELESFDWDELEDYTWNELEFSETTGIETLRNVVTLYPHETLQAGDRFMLERALDRLKPAGALLLVSDEIPEREVRRVPFGALSLSEKWEIRPRVRNSRINSILPYPNLPEDEFIDPPQAAWHGYSGEAWTVLDQDPRSVAFSTPGEVDAHRQVPLDAVETPAQPLLTRSGAGQAVSLPEYALQAAQGIFSGRSVSDGIVTANPYDSRPGAQTGIWLDRIPGEAFRDTEFPTTASTRFWTSPIRDPEAEDREVLEIRFDDPVTINHLSYEFARFPCRISVQRWNSSIAEWQEIRQFTYRESSPYGINNTPPPDAVHPYHFGNNHWHKDSATITPITTRILRFVIQRVDGDGPVGIEGDRIAYPVGLRKVDFGWRSDELAKVPHLPPLVPVHSGRNPIGLQTQYFLERARADSVLDNSPRPWISEPQATQDSVVNLYLPVGDGTIPEVVNQLWLDPVHVGPRMNLYYTSTQPQGVATATAVDDVVPVVDGGGSVTPVLKGTQGLDFPLGSSGWVDLDVSSESDGSSMWIGLTWRLTSVPQDSGANQKLAPLFTLTLGDPLSVFHGVVDGSYRVLVTNGTHMTRFQWSEVPAPSSVLKLTVPTSVGQPRAQIDDGPIQIGHDVDSDLTAGAQFDPRLELIPVDWWQQQATGFPFYIRAMDATRPSLRNRGTAGASLDVELDGAFGLFPADALGEIVLWLPGTDDNYVEIDHQSNLIVAGDISVGAQVSFDNISDDRVQWLVNAFGSPQDEHEGYALGVRNRRIIFAHGDAGGYAEVESTELLPVTRRPLFVAATLDDSEDLVRMWYRQGGSWQLLEEVDLPARSGTLGTQADVPLMLGGNADGEDTFHGALHRAFVASDITPDGEPGTTYVFRLTPTDPHYTQQAEAPLGYLVVNGDPVVIDGAQVIVSRQVAGSFFTTSNHAASIVQSSTGMPSTLVPAPGVVVEPGSSPATFSTGFADLTQDRHFSMFVSATISRLPTSGLSPVFTNKASPDVSSRGWGIYVDPDGEFVLRVSDGTTQIDESLSGEATSALAPPWAIGVTCLGDTVQATLLRWGHDNSVESTSASVAGLQGATNSQPIRLLADATDTTPGVFYDAAATTGAVTSIEDFDQVALSIGRVQARYTVGSSWQIVADGLSHLGEVSEGEWVIAATDGSVSDDGVILSGPVFNRLAPGLARYGRRSAGVGGVRLLGSAIGYGSGPGAGYFEDTSRFHAISISNERHDVRGTFLRYHPGYFGWSDDKGMSIGFMGGSPNTWESAEWTPIGQAALTRGTLNFEDVRAVAFKLEFSNLSAEPYDSFMPTNREVTRFLQSPDANLGRAQDPVSIAMIELTSQSRFPDFLSLPFGQDPLVNEVSPTSAMVPIDGSVVEQINQEFGFPFGVTQWQPGHSIPMNAEAGEHQYFTSKVQAVSRTAFFVGLRNVEVRKVGKLKLEDARSYTDTFATVENLEPETITFQVDPGAMRTPEAPASSLLNTPRVAESKVHESRRPVTAVQFATQQTGTVQVIPDDEFKNPNLSVYDFDSTDQWHHSGDGIAFWDPNFGTVRVTRDPSVLDAFYAPDTPVVHPPVSPVLASGFGRTITLDVSSTGGISSPTVAISPRGTLTAATRVAAVNELQGDLYLRIYGSDGTTLLAERSFRPKVGVPTELVLPYTIGQNPGVESAVQIRVEQDGPWRDSWAMYALSAFDASVLWEFSVDGGDTWVPGTPTRGLRFGVVDFPEPGPSLKWRVVAYRNNTVIDAIRIRPWYTRRMGAAL